MLHYGYNAVYEADWAGSQWVEFASPHEVEEYFDRTGFIGFEHGSGTIDSACRITTIQEDSSKTSYETIHEENLSRVVGKRIAGVYLVGEYEPDDDDLNTAIPRNTQLVLELDPSGLLVAQRIYYKYNHETNFYHSWEDAIKGDFPLCDAKESAVKVL